VERVPNPRDVECGEAERMLGDQVLELHVELAVGHELARDHERVLAAHAVDRKVDGAAIAGGLRHHDRCDFVAGHELAVVERSLVLLLEAVQTAHVAAANRFHVPDVAALARAGRVLVAEGLARFAEVAAVAHRPAIPKSDIEWRQRLAQVRQASQACVKPSLAIRAAV